MKRIELLFFAAVLAGSVSIAAYSQDTITTEEAAKFLGLQKTVCGKVVSSIIQPAPRENQPSSTLINHTPTKSSLCSSGDRTGASSGSRRRKCMREKRFA